MASCAVCGTTIIFGGKKDGTLRFCSANCLQKGVLLRTAEHLPPGPVEETVLAIHSGLCPKCRGHGPVDVHTSYRVWSALFMTSHSSRPQICCAACGKKALLGDTLFCLLLGWWGFPWGLLVTPVQIGRNLVGLLRSTEETRPSEKLRKIVRIQLAAAALLQQQQGQSKTAPTEAHPVG